MQVDLTSIVHLRMIDIKGGEQRDGNLPRYAEKLRYRRTQRKNKKPPQGGFFITINKL